MDGLDSDKFTNFKSLVCAGLQEAKRHIEEIESLIMILAKGKFCCLFYEKCRFQDAMFRQARDADRRNQTTTKPEYRCDAQLHNGIRCAPTV